MSATPLLERTLTDLAAALSRREVSSEEATRAALSRIEATDGRLGAFLRVSPEPALEAARASDARRARGEATSPLDGVPLALKDIFLTRGVETTAGSRILAGFIPPFDATVVERLRGAGAVLVGKLNMDEFAMGSSTENSAFGPCRNPWDLTRTPGGSSGGSAAAVAARQVFGAFGTDTGGSIRQPASLCGVVGLKPTYGRVSRYGVVAFASSLDQVGPLGRTVADAATLLGAVAGHDPRDQTSSTRPVPDYLAGLEGGARGLRIGVPREWFQGGTEAGVERRVREALAAFEAMGARLVDVELPHSRYGVAAYYLVAPAEASSNLARYDGVRFGLRAPGPRPRRHVRRDPRRRLRRRGQAAHHARHLRALGRLPRRLLPARPRRSARWCAATSTGPSSGATWWPDPSHPPSHSRSARRSTTRCRCTWPTSSPSPATWRRCRGSRCRPGCTPGTGCRSGCSWSGAPSTSRRCSAPPRALERELGPSPAPEAIG